MRPEVWMCGCWSVRQSGNEALQGVSRAVCSVACGLHSGRVGDRHLKRDSDWH